MKFGKRQRLVAVGVGLAAIAIITTVVLVLPLSGSAGSCTPSAPSYLGGADSEQLLACGTKAALDPNSYVSYSMPRVSDTETVVGQYSVTESANASVEAFLINGSQLSELTTNPHPTAPPTGAVSPCGVVLKCSLSISVPPSPTQYFVIVENLGASSASIDWTQSLVLYYVSR